jgi:hypothetical protein
MSTSHRPSRIVPADLLGGRRVAVADDAYFHVTPDIVAVEESNTPHTNTKVTLIDITYCLENGSPKPSRISGPTTPHCDAPSWIRDTMYPRSLRLSCVSAGQYRHQHSKHSRILALTGALLNHSSEKPTLPLVSTIMRRMCHARRAIEAVKMGPQGIVSRLFQRDKPRRGHQPRTHIPGARPKRPRTN